MEGKKRDRPVFFRQVFGQLIDDYKNNVEDVRINILKAFRQLEVAEFDPSLLAYSIILGKDSKIGTSLKKEAGEVTSLPRNGEIVIWRNMLGQIRVSKLMSHYLNTSSVLISL